MTQLFRSHNLWLGDVLECIQVLGDVFVKAKGRVTKLFGGIESVTQLFRSHNLWLADVLECIQVLGDVFVKAKE